MRRLESGVLGLFVLYAGCDPATPAGRDACDYIADACHGGVGVAEACHEVGHDGDLATCEEMLATCLVTCTVDAGVTGTDAGADAPTAVDVGPVDAGTESVVIRFDARVGSQPFACGSTYTLGTPAHTAEPVDFRFYAQDVRLIAADGTEVTVDLEESDFQAREVALLDFEDATGACAYGDIPFELNHVDLTSLPSPLNRTSLFWGWRFGHLFLSAMSRAATEAPAPVDAFDPDAGLDAGTITAFVEHATHVGSTGCTGNPEAGEPVTSCSRPNRAEIRLTGFDPATATIIADFGEIKADDDVTGESCHSFSPDCAYAYDALGMNFATGSLTPTTQTVFRVE
jgi:hypothetical protein